MTSTIDLDRGVMVGVYGKLGDKSDSIYVYMYLDTPGDYMNEFGGPVPQAMAKEAGFDVMKFAKQKARRDKLKAFEREVDSELGSETIRTVLVEGYGYKVIAVSDDAAILTDEDENQFGQVMPKVNALKMFKNLTAEAAEATIKTIPATPTKEVSHGRTAS